MRLDEISYIIVLAAIAMTVQRLIQAHPVGSQSDDENIRKCGVHLHVAVRTFCKGVFNQNFDPTSAHEVQKLQENIITKCCNKPCPESTLRRYCGSGLASPDASEPSTIRAEPLIQSKSQRSRRGQQTKVKNNSLQPLRKFNQRENLLFSKHSKKNMNKKKSCIGLNPHRQRGKQSRMMSSDETTESEGLVYTSDSTITGNEIEETDNYTNSDGRTTGNRTNPGNLVTDRPVRHSFVVHPVV